MIVYGYLITRISSVISSTVFTVDSNVTSQCQKVGHTYQRAKEASYTLVTSDSGESGHGDLVIKKQRSSSSVLCKNNEVSKVPRRVSKDKK